LAGTAENAKEKAAETISALENEKKLRLAVEKELAHKVVESLPVEEINGVKVIARRCLPLTPQSCPGYERFAAGTHQERHYRPGDSL